MAPDHSAAHNEPSEVPTLIRANVAFDTAIERKPDFAQAYFMHWYNAATAALVLGRPEETLRLVDEAERLVGRHFLTTDARLQALFALQRHQDAERILAAGTFTPFVHVQVSAAAGRKAEAMDALAAFGEGHWLTYRLVSRALIGDLGAANRIAAAIDATPLGAAMLAEAYHICLCGAPFALQATPNFARQVKEGNLAWPPPTAVDYPLKAW